MPVCPIRGNPLLDEVGKIVGWVTQQQQQQQPTTTTTTTTTTTAAATAAATYPSYPSYPPHTAQQPPIPGKNNDPPPLYPNPDHSLTLIVP